MSLKKPYVIVNVNAQFARLSPKGALILWTRNLEYSTRFAIKDDAVAAIAFNRALQSCDVRIMNAYPPGTDLTE